jgi:DNA repair exonuclease SbcCD ATPase subunit
MAASKPMSESKAAYEPTGLERFSHLEDRIHRIVEAFKTVRKENEALRSESQRLRSDLETLRQAEGERVEFVANLQREREQLRERVERALELLATVEAK